MKCGPGWRPCSGTEAEGRSVGGAFFVQLTWSRLNQDLSRHGGGYAPFFQKPSVYRYYSGKIYETAHSTWADRHTPCSATRSSTPGGGATPASLDFTEKDFADESMRQCLNHLESVPNPVRRTTYLTPTRISACHGSSGWRQPNCYSGWGNC